MYIKKKIQEERAVAVQRFIQGENPTAICAAVGKSTRWLYKWVARHIPDDPVWCEDLSRRPHTSSQRTPEEIEDIVEMVRLSLYNKDHFCGDQAIQWEMKDMEVQPMLPMQLPNQTQQVDLVGPCYLAGPIRFYSLHSIDIAINRCGIEPMLSKAAQSIIDAVYAIWKRMGIPENLQVDNEMAFFGSPSHPRGMGPLIRLCLLYGVALWFIPPAEPWRNGVVEKFNDHYRQKFLSKFTMTSEPELRQASLAYEHTHNSIYRYSKIQGQTPLKALARSGQQLIFPDRNKAPQYPLEKPEEGLYHLVRFILSDCMLNIFGEMFSVPSETQYEYVVATIDVKEQKLKLFLDKFRLKNINID